MSSKSQPEYTPIRRNVKKVDSDSITEVKNVEISPMHVSPVRDPDHSEIDLKSLMNKTKSPIKNEIKPDIDPEGQIGVIEIKGEEKIEKKETLSHTNPPRRKKYIKVFKKTKTQNADKIIHTRSLLQSDFEPETAAADRVESYYLPPAGQSHKPKTSSPKQPSNIDFETVTASRSSAASSSPKLSGGSSPPDVLVTYDGKRVSGASLTTRPFQKSTLLSQRGSKAAELIKARPQFVPFKGELPPLNPDVLFDTKHVQRDSNVGVLSRDLDTPLPPPSGSTKLTRIR